MFPAMLIRRLFRPLAVLVLLACALAVPPGALASGGEVLVYNWSEYIPDSVLENFTRETGIRVVYETFETSEAMYAGVREKHGKPYDVVVSSGQYVDQMRQSRFLQRIDHGKLSNRHVLDPAIMDRDFDPENRFSIPYMWGAVGIAYNTKHVPKGAISRWTDLQRPEYRGRIIMTDEMREDFGFALLAQGRSANTRNPNDIRAGYDFLVKLKPSVLRFDVTSMKDALVSEEAWIAPIWNGDYLVAKEKKPELDFVFPAEGAVLWVDSFIIPVNAKNVENAHIFINYMLRPEVAVACVMEYKYLTANIRARSLLPDELRRNAALVPDKGQQLSGEFITGVGDALKVYEKHWKRLLATKQGGKVP